MQIDSLAAAEEKEGLAEFAPLQGSTYDRPAG